MHAHTNMAGCRAHEPSRARTQEGEGFSSCIKCPDNTRRYPSIGAVLTGANKTSCTCNESASLDP